MRYWIQRADLTVEELEAQAVGDLCSAFDDHDWAAEAAYRESLESSSQEWCPPGFGVVPGDGRILHICPDDGGAAHYHYHYPERRRWLGVFPRQRQATITWEGESASASEVLELLVLKRHEELVRHSLRAV